MPNKYHIDVDRTKGSQTKGSEISKIWKSNNKKSYDDEDKHDLDKFEKSLSGTKRQRRYDLRDLQEDLQEQRDDLQEQLKDLQQRYKILRDKYNSAENLREDNIELTRRNNSLLTSYNAMAAVVRKHRYHENQQ